MTKKHQRFKLIHHHSCTRNVRTRPQLPLERSYSSFGRYNLCAASFRASRWIMTNRHVHVAAPHDTRAVLGSRTNVGQYQRTPTLRATTPTSLNSQYGNPLR